MRRAARERAAPHTPVMVRELLAALGPSDGETYLDGTFGAGGHARAVLDAAECTVLGVDRDPDAVVGSRDLVHRYGGRLAVLKGRFGDMVELLHGVGVFGHRVAFLLHRDGGSSGGRGFWLVVVAGTGRQQACGDDRD